MCFPWNQTSLSLCQSLLCSRKHFSFTTVFAWRRKASGQCCPSSEDLSLHENIDSFLFDPFSYSLDLSLFGPPSIILSVSASSFKYLRQLFKLKSLIDYWKKIPPCLSGESLDGEEWVKNGKKFEYFLLFFYVHLKELEGKIQGRGQYLFSVFSMSVEEGEWEWELSVGLTICPFPLFKTWREWVLVWRVTLEKGLSPYVALPGHC